LLIDVAGSGVAQRIRSCGTRTRIVAVASLCATAGVVIDATVFTSADTLTAPPTPVTVLWLAPNAFLPANVRLLHAPASELPRSFQPLPRGTTVQFAPGTSGVIGINGPPVDIVLNPTSGKLLSIKPRG
jgi:hypothetical protein